MLSSPVQLVVYFKPPFNPNETGARAVLPAEAEFIGIMPKGSPARIHRFGRVHKLDLGITLPAAAMDFRPMPPKLMRVNQNQEAVLALDRGTSEIVRFDQALEVPIASLPMEDATAVAYSHDGELLAAGNAEGLLRIWKHGRQGMEEVLTEQVCRHEIKTIALSANNDVVFFTTVRGEFLRMVVQAGSMPTPCMNDEYLDGTPFQFNCYTVACHPRNNAVVAFGGDSNMVHLVDYGTGKTHVIATEVGDYVREVRFLPNEREISVVGARLTEVYDFVNAWTLDSNRFTRTQSKAVPDGMPLTARQFGGSLYVAHS